MSPKSRVRNLGGVLCFFLMTVFGGVVPADDRPDNNAANKGVGADRGVKRLLLIGQGPDNHAWSTHEYMSGMHVVASMLGDFEKLQTIITKADEPWADGPELLSGADAAVLFVSEGAKWLAQDRRRLEAFQDLARRGGGLAVLHWGMGTKDAKHIEPFVALFGGCHGGPDRKFKIVEVRAEPEASQHEVLRGIEPFDVHEEFYYTLKMAKSEPAPIPLLRVPIDGDRHAVAWAWERPDGGRSFGFSGLHYHKNWQLEPYRRLVAQGILWTLRLPIPEEGFDVRVADEVLEVQRPEPKP